MKKNWFISDLHLGHKNIIKYCNRPFESVEEMNKVLIENWNSIVDEDDIIYFLGDFCLGNYETFKNFAKMLNGHKRFIMGNHDHFSKKQIKAAGFELVEKELLLKIDDLNLHLFHYPIEVENGEILVYGHVHEKFVNLQSRAVCVCVEQTNYRPIELNELLERINK